MHIMWPQYLPCTEEITAGFDTLGEQGVPEGGRVHHGRIYRVIYFQNGMQVLLIKCDPRSLAPSVGSDVSIHTHTCESETEQTDAASVVSNMLKLDKEV